MGKKRTTIKVKCLNPYGKHKGKGSRGRVYAVYRNSPAGYEYCIPNTNTRNRKEAIKTAAKIRKEKWRQ